MKIPFISKKPSQESVTATEDMRLDLAELLMRKGYSVQEAANMSSVMIQSVKKKNLMREVL